MEITFLGTGSAYPSPTRAASCTAFRHEDYVWIFDCGDGTQVQLMKSSLKAGKINKIFITHLHGDHVFGLPGLLCTISQNNQRIEPVELYGPQGLRKFVATSLELSQSILGFSYVVHEMKVLPSHYPVEFGKWEVDTTVRGGKHPNEGEGRLIEPDFNGVYSLYEDSKISIKAVWLKHRIPSYGFVIEETPLPGKLDVDKVQSYGIPLGPLCAKLKNGQVVTSPSGKEVHPSDVVGPKRPGRKIIICGDSCESHELIKVGMDADILIHEATLEDSLLESALEKGHSTPGMAAKLAADLNAKKLILTHFSQRYLPVSSELKKGDESVEVLLTEAIKVLDAERVIVAEDFLAVPIPLKKAES